jgi:DNA-binding transcriptional ArsR family regulator
MSEQAEAMERVFAALADPTRRQVLDAIAARGEATATTIAAELPVSRQAIVKHLAVLDRAGLVAGRREGREMRYAVAPDRLDDIARWIATLATEWEARLARIKQIAESGESRSRGVEESRSKSAVVSQKPTANSQQPEANGQ